MYGVTMMQNDKLIVVYRMVKIVETLQIYAEIQNSI